MKKKFLVTVLSFFLLTATAHAESWYEGGNLHRANAIAWQKANNENKVATCADFIAGMWEDGQLSNELSKKIKNIDDIQPYAELLASQLDDAFMPEIDPKKNKQLFENQKVSSFATMIMMMMGWTK
ncbi:hypothetical protein ID858_17900 [Xenorhabdus sp. DI]|uniref:hypothetical protein n=1 Tax=Xenorhabdus doucetiae TaxID=351671 RepID=UPI00199FCE9D|nr:MULTISPECIES: hypothetical protein [unclassified Xenorhabdus]MBD2786645.1 hypothetical protein [Xenorhabdus sp. 3]MBD2790360.1 hypothetical protein [Xenorhabdus sp. DI]